MPGLFVLFGAAFLLVLSFKFQPARKFDKDSLAGLPGVGLIIEPVPDLEHSDGLNETELREEIERRFREAGVGILSKDDLRQAPGYPLLDVSVQAHEIPGQDRVCAFSVAVEVQQIVTLQRSADAEAFSTTWSSRSFGSVTTDGLGALQGNVLDHIDHFINDWLSVNPKQES